MTDPIVRFVSAPTRDARTRFEFHLDDGGGGQRRTSDRASWSWTPGAMLGEPDGVGADYGLGRIEFTHTVIGSRQDALQTMGALARELQRDENYLLFQLSPADAPMWLRTYRGSPGALTFPYVDPDKPQDDVWLMDVSLPTEPTSRGERVSFDVTVTNDPAVENGLAVVLPEIRGDAPAPLVVEIEAADTYVAPLLSVAAYDGDAPALQFWQAEDWTLGTDATLNTSGGAFYSGGGNFVDVSFATEDGMATRLTGSITPERAGRWMLYGRFNAITGVTVKGGGAALTKANSHLWSADDAFLVTSLGEYSFPAHNPPLGRPYELAAADDTVTVRASATDPALHALKVDYIVAVPVDGIDMLEPARSLAVRELPVAETLRVNGECEACQALDADGALLPGTPATATGSFPRVVPGANNILHFIELDPVALIAKTTNLTISYQPRHLYLPGGD